jgi:copper chaperone CopZ
MKNIMILALLLCMHTAKAQVTKVSLQASGLTCSMCSNAINKALKSLDFVDQVKADIKNSVFVITFKPGTEADFDLLKRKVEDAGFFVANFYATVHFNAVTAVSDQHLVLNNRTFHFLNIKDQLLDGDRTIRFLDKGFVSSKEFKKNSGFTKMDCYKTGMAADCCKKDGLTNGTRIFHVTI